MFLAFTRYASVQIPFDEKRGSALKPSAELYVSLAVAVAKFVTLII